MMNVILSHLTNRSSGRLLPNEVVKNERVWPHRLGDYVYSV